MLYSAIACLVSYLICNYLKTSKTSYDYLSTKSWMQSRLQTCGNGCETTFAINMDGFKSYCGLNCHRGNFKNLYNAVMWLIVCTKAATCQSKHSIQPRQTFCHHCYSLR